MMSVKTRATEITGVK